MLLTEREAKTKWCAQARVAVNGTGSLNRADGCYTGCLGSECMAWRWLDKTAKCQPVKTVDVPVGKASTSDALKPTPGHKWVSGKRDHNAVTWGLFPMLGYCGLAGKPNHECPARNGE